MYIEKNPPKFNVSWHRTDKHTRSITMMVQTGYHGFHRR